MLEESKVKGPPILFEKAPEREQPIISDLLSDKKVLLVEDSLIIALDAEDILRRLGAGTVVTEAAVADAIAAIEEQRPDIAVLDINLGSSNSFPIASHLIERGIPFMFASGYGEQAKIPDELRGQIVLQKPYTLASMNRTLAELVGVSSD